MNSFLDSIRTFFIVNDELTRIMIYVYLAVSLFIIFLRIIICLSYQTQYTIFRFSAKELKSKEDIKNFKAGLISKVVKDYTKSCERHVSYINTSAIVNKHLLSTGFLFWKFESMSAFIKQYEGSQILIGILLTVFLEYSQLFGILTISVFLLLRLFSSFFDFELSKERLRNEIIEYVDREISQFFILDMTASIGSLKNELVKAASTQAEKFSAAIEKLGSDLSGVLRLSIAETSKSVEETIRTISNYSDIIKEPLEEWKEAILLSADAQQKIQSSLDNLNSSTSGLQNSSDSLSNSLSSYAEMIKQEKQAIFEQGDIINSLVSRLMENNDHISVHSSAISKTIDYIAKNQDVLEESINKYELSLESITSKLGDGLSSMINFQVQNAYNSLNESLAESMKQSIINNNELITKLQNIFNSFNEQNRSEANAILNLKDVMDIHFRSIYQKMDSLNKDI